MKRRRVYVAGAYSADNVLQVLENMRKGMKLATEAFQEDVGILPFAPWFDYHFFLMQDPEKRRLTIEDIYQYSLSFLENWAEAVLVQQDGWITSKGTVNEINKAKELGIPVFFSLEALKKWIIDGVVADELKEERERLEDLIDEPEVEKE
jgi:hypothetical protein